jgi:hypothetical protein
VVLCRATGPLFNGYKWARFRGVNSVRQPYSDTENSGDFFPPIYSPTRDFHTRQAVCAARRSPLDRALLLKILDRGIHFSA